MFGRRHREPVPELNTSSTADISFMLLVFFLVTSSMDSDKGLATQLPPPEDNTEGQSEQLLYAIVHPAPKESFRCFLFQRFHILLQR